MLDMKTIKSILKNEGLVAYARLYADGLLSEKSFLKVVEVYKKTKVAK